MKILKAIKKGEIIEAEIETDQPETQDIDVNTGQVVSQSDKKLVMKVSTYDDKDELQIKDRLLKEVESLEEPYNFSDNTLDKDKTPWFHKRVQQRTQDILDRELKNRRETLKSRPYLREIYRGWKYAKKKKKD